MDDTCLICGNFTSGLHLQVLACRACATFFTRSIKAKKTYRCQTGEKNCDVTKKTKTICKFCRMKKCTDIGMVLVGYSTLPKPLNQKDDGPYLAEFLKNNANDDYFVDLIKSRLSVSPVCSTENGIRLSEMQKMTMGLTKFWEVCWPSEHVKVLYENFDKLAIFKFMTDYLLQMAELLTYSDSVMKLTLDNRISLFKHFWINFMRLERLYVTCQVRGYELDDNVVIFDKTQAIDFTRSIFTINDMSEKEKKHFIKMREPLIKVEYTYLSYPFKTLKVSKQELLFVANLILWDIKEINNLPDVAVLMADEVIQQITHEMHGYYVFEMKNPNYSERITKLTKLAYDVQRVVKDQRNMAMIGEIFNLFDCGFPKHAFFED